MPLGGLTTLSKLALTSADVSGVPSWNFTPVRILKVNLENKKQYDFINDFSFIFTTVFLENVILLLLIYICIFYCRLSVFGRRFPKIILLGLYPKSLYHKQIQNGRRHFEF